MFEMLRKLHYKWVLFSEKQIMKLHSMNSLMEVSTLKYTYIEIMPSDTIDIFYRSNVFPDVVTYEPMYFQKTLDNLITLLYGSSEREVDVKLRCYRGILIILRFKKKRKKLGYSDYCKLAYIIRMINRYAFPERMYKRLIKEACKLSCKERKRREKYELKCNEL